MDRATTKRTKKANRTRFLSKSHAKNIRARETKRRRSATRRLKAYTKEMNQAAIIARMVAEAAQQMGVAAPAGGAGAGAGAGAQQDILEAPVNLDQAVVIMNQVANQFDNPAPALLEVQNQAAAVRERGRGCIFQIKVKHLYFVLMLIAHGLSLKDPFIAPPRETIYFDSAAGYMALMGSGAGFFSLEVAGTFTACGIGLQLAGAVTRGVTAATGVHPMTSNNIKREGLKFAEYMPGPASKVMQLGKVAGLAEHAVRTSYKHAGTSNTPWLRGGIPSEKPKPPPGPSYIKELIRPLSNTAVNIITEAGSRFGQPKSKMLGAVAGAATGAAISGLIM